MKTLKTINGYKEGKYVGNVIMNVEWKHVYVDTEGNHYIYGAGYYKPITIDLYDIFTV